MSKGVPENDNSEIVVTISMSPETGQAVNIRGDATIQVVLGMLTMAQAQMLSVIKLDKEVTNGND